MPKVIGKKQARKKAKRFRPQDINRWKRGRLVTKLISLHGDTCFCCGGRLDRSLKPDDPMYITIEHYHPSCVGGDDAIENLRLSHMACNQKRGDGSICK